MRFDLPMPVVAKMPTCMARLRPGMPTSKSTTVSPERRCPIGRSPIFVRRNSKSAASGASTLENWVGSDFGLRNSCCRYSSGGVRYPRHRQSATR